MKKVRIWIEEHLCREVEVEVPDDMNVADRMECAENIVREQYKNGEIILDADDFNGVVEICVQDVETETTTEWYDM